MIFSQTKQMSIKQKEGKIERINDSIKDFEDSVKNCIANIIKKKLPLNPELFTEGKIKFIKLRNCFLKHYKKNTI